MVGVSLKWRGGNSGVAGPIAGGRTNNTVE
jgi:hypothetical protein